MSGLQGVERLLRFEGIDGVIERSHHSIGMLDGNVEFFELLLRFDLRCLERGNGVLFPL